MKRIDINCDMGEGGKYDQQIMPLISSCNIACGGHVGDKATIAETIAFAHENSVVVGAHPAYPDKENFGRKSMDISAERLKETLQEQIRKVRKEAEKQNACFYHVKPHGALYNDAKKNSAIAKIIVDSIVEIDPQLVLFVPPQSALLEEAKGRLKMKIEGFADRRYEHDFSLTSRTQPDAVLHHEEDILKQVIRMVLHDEVEAKDGTVLHQKFDTICVHSDTPNSLSILRFLNKQLPEHNIKIQDDR